MFLASSIGPILYGYAQYGYDIQRYVSPEYTPPNINFASNIVGFDYEGNRVITILRVDNLGEVDVAIDYLNASLYGEDGRHITNIYLESPMEIPHNTSRELTMYMIMDVPSIENLITYYMETRSFRFIIRGTLGVKVFSSTAEFPLQIPVNVPRDMILKYLMGIDVYISGFQTTTEGLVFTIKIKNPTLVTWTIKNIDLKLYTQDNDLIGYLNLLESTQIQADSTSEAKLLLIPTPEAYDILIQYYAKSEIMTFYLNGTVTLESLGYTYTVQVNEPVGISRNTFLGG